MFKQKILFLFLIFFITGYAKEIKNYHHSAYNWGGKGYDQNGKHHRFSTSIKFDFRHNKQTKLAIVFDAKETMQYHLKYMTLFSKNKTLQSIGSCTKYQKHITAPVSCYFNIEEVQNFHGKGEISIHFSKNFTLQENIDFDKLQNFITTNME